MTRGTLGGELRRLRLAADICLMPSIIILEEPIVGLDFGVALDLMKRLKSLADLGRTVVCSFSKPDSQTFELFDDVVLVVEGRTIFTGKKENIIPHFTSKVMGYTYSPEVSNVTEFIMDVALGIERPTGHRSAVTPYDMQQNFLSSDFHSSNLSAKLDLSECTKLLPAVRVTPYLDLILKTRKRALWRRIYVAWERAIVTKFSEFAVLRKSLISAIVPALLIGYFLYGQGNLDKKHDGYTMSLFNLPYNETTNVASNIFIANAYSFVTQVLNVHIIVQKMKVFRFEQRSGLMSGGVFFISTFLAESVFSVFYNSVFSSIVYYMMDLGSGLENFRYFVNVQALTCLYSLLTCLLLAAVIKKEFIVRDVFLMFFFLMVMISGFVFTFIVLRQEMIDISELNPIRWTFEALMNWKFLDYKDGEQYLATYSFASFDHQKIFEIFRNFFLFTGALLLLALIPGPRVLRRCRADEQVGIARHSVSRYSVDSDFESSSGDSKTLRESFRTSASFRHSERHNSRNSERSAAPVLLLRTTTSGAASVALSRSASSRMHSEKGNCTLASLFIAKVYCRDLCRR